ncbi:MAG: VCBS repeat-containing protein [Thermoleophilia bacterium]
MRARLAILFCIPFCFLGLVSAAGAVGAQAAGFDRTDFDTGALPAGVAVGDLNGDGEPDLVTANNGYPNSVSVLLGGGAGAFAAKSDFTTGNGPLAVAVGDVNEDGRLDVVTANDGGDEWAGSVSVLLGDGSGGLSAPTDFVAGLGCCSVVVADVDNDGHLDVVTANGAEGDGVTDAPGNSVSILLGNGSGAFASRADFAVGDQPRQVVVADFNHDGRLDLATANSGTWSTVGATLSVLLGDGAGGFGSRRDLTTGAYPCAVAAGDLNGDESDDLVSANRGDKTVSVLLGDGNGDFAAKVDYEMGDVYLSPRSVVVVDLDGDGKQDVAASANGRIYYPFYVEDYSAVLVRLGDGDGTLGGQTSFNAGETPCEIAAGDLNGDGASDLVTANWNGDSVSVFLQKVVLLPRTVTTPVAPSVMYHSKAKTIYGYLKPRHTAGTNPVQLQLYKKNSSGAWVLQSSVSAKVSDYSSYSKYAASVKLTSTGSWRVRAYCPATGEYLSASSGYDNITVKDVTVGNPVAPATMYANKAKSVYGYLKPRHTAGTYPVRIYKYRYVGGIWKSYGFVKAKAYNYSTYTKYVASVKPPYKGKWRLRAYHPACSQHRAKWSARYDYVTVR